MQINKSKNKILFRELFLIDDNIFTLLNDILSKMSIEEKIGQLIYPYVFGQYYSYDSIERDRLNKLVKEKKVGGFSFFKGTVYDYVTLSNYLQEKSEIPLLMGADFERGLAMRIENVTEFPFALSVGHSGNPLLSYEIAKITGEEARAIGIHHNYAPVADLGNLETNPIINVRAYSSDPVVVAQHCIEYIKGCKESRVMSTVKHFPGHGFTSDDSHSTLPVIDRTKEELNEDLYPFKECINNGVQSIMIGHLNVPSLDPSNIPATLSYSIVTQLLKEELNFDGLVITDAMNMFGVTSNISVGEASVNAINAGVDMLLLPPDEEIVINKLLNAVEYGDISIDRINQSVIKILAAKHWLGLFDNKFVDVDNVNKKVFKNETKEKAISIASQGLRVIKDELMLLPIIDKGNIISITISDIVEGEREKYFSYELNRHFTLLNNIYLNPHSSEKHFQSSLMDIDHDKVLIVSLFNRIRAYKGNTELPQNIDDFIHHLQAMRGKVVFVCFGNPYIMKKYDRFGTLIFAYGDAIPSQDAVIFKLLGKTINKI